MSDIHLYAANCRTLVQHTDLPGCDDWAEMYKIIGLNVAFVDRTEEVITPFRTKLYPKFKMPTDIKNYGYTYEECCERRAIEIYELSKKIDKPIYIFWSGGIDSTLVFVSLKKVMSESEFNDRVVVVMNYDSYKEYPWFYVNYIRGKVKTLSSETFSDYFDKRCIIVGGEFNDQLFGSDLIKKVEKTLGIEYIHVKYSRELITSFFKSNGISEFAADRWYDIVHESIIKSPVALSTIFDFLWWFNFNFKWQAVFFRMLMRCEKENMIYINQDFVDNYYHHFYSEEYFQIWSMTNHEYKINNDWKSYKYLAKELICEYTKDEDYKENKTKLPSLYRVFMQKTVPSGLSSNYDFLFDLNAEELYVPDNSFVQLPLNRR